MTDRADIGWAVFFHVETSNSIGVTTRQAASCNAKPSVTARFIKIADI
jgi:hypothetical protein